MRLKEFILLGFLSGALVITSVACEDQTPKGTSSGGDTSSDTDSSGDGSIDQFTYDPSYGSFNEDGIWEQAQEFCYPPDFPADKKCEGGQGLWSKALQMALWFFNVNKSGEGVYCTDVQWRGDAHLSDAHILLKAGDPNGVDMSQEYIDKYKDVFDPDGDGEVDLAGGYYDAGDFIKFELTQGYMASTIAWSMYEFPDAFSKTGLEGEALDQIKWVADFFLKSTFIEDKSLPVDQWNVVGFAHQVGDDSDHTCGWMPPELRDPSFCPRKGFFATHENPAADVTANSAAALALVGALLKEEDPEYSKKCINYAIALYNFAGIEPSALATAAGGLYVSEYAYDDLAWAASWLYEATKDDKYLDEAIEWLYNLPGFSKTCVEELVKWNGYSDTNACWSESWTHVWNSLRSGVFVRLAAEMTEANNKYAGLFQMIAKIDTMQWVDGKASPQGFSCKVDVSWGMGRYNSAGQLVALAYAKNFPDDPDADRIIEWAKTQSLYLLGDNEVNGDPEGKSFMMGFTELSPNTPTQPHHAAGHASIYGLPEKPEDNRHIIWGALVNGPTCDDTHVDDRADFGSNEVTIDYNAAWVGALAGNTYFQSKKDGEFWKKADWCPEPDFPPIEPPIDEFYTMGRINNEGDCRSQVEITMINESIHPPRYNEFLTARYYIDVTELEEKGIDPATMTAKITYDNGAAEFGEPTQISGPFKCEDTESEEAKNTWYFTLSYEGYKFWGEQVKLKGPRTTQVDFGVPDGGSCTWDASNDWSYDSLPTDERIKTPHITAYGEDGKLLWGEEPPCHPIQKKIVPPPSID
ncbi:MAG: glycoside hydrolase family 9 protein [Deltaproteobacteria bacterium]|nr:glycoside hydrolase family 9 protein [Deltaproteobacteria bacterium]